MFRGSKATRALAAPPSSCLREGAARPVPACRSPRPGPNSPRGSHRLSREEPD